EGALDTGAPHGRGSRRALFLIASSGGEEAGRVAGGFSVGAGEGEGRCGEGGVPGFWALSAVGMDPEALPPHIRGPQGKGFMESESQAIDGGEVDLVVQGCRGGEEPPDLLHTEDGGETVRGLSPKEGEGVPVALEDVLIEEADATVADAHGRWGEAVDIFA